VKRHVVKLWKSLYGTTWRIALVPIYDLLLPIVESLGMHIVPRRTLVLSPACRILLPIIERLGVHMIFSRPHDSASSNVSNQSKTSSTLPFGEEGLKRWRSEKPIREESEIICPTIRLDTFMRLMDIPSVDYLKIHAQGADLAVVRSAGERLKDTREILLEVQVSDTPPYTGASTKDSVLEFMRDAGFALVDKTRQSFGQEENLRFKRV
jgi:hypothetical protein